MITLLVCALTLQSDPLIQVARQRGRFGAVAAPSNDAYVCRAEDFGLGTVILFEVGDARSRFFFDRAKGTLALMKSQHGRPMEVWRARLTGKSDKSTIAGTGTLDAILGRNWRWVESGTSAGEIQKWLNKKTAFAAYVFDPMGGILLSWFYLPDGHYAKESKPSDYHGSPFSPPGVGEPYPITDEERHFLDEKAKRVDSARHVPAEGFGCQKDQDPGTARWLSLPPPLPTMVEL